jgi:hypothetical protein
MPWLPNADRWAAGRRCRKIGACGLMLTLRADPSDQPAVGPEAAASADEDVAIVDAIGDHGLALFGPTAAGRPQRKLTMADVREALAKPASKALLEPLVVICAPPLVWVVALSTSAMESSGLPKPE